MKKIAAALILVAFAAGNALAADTIKLPAKNGDVPFPHGKHKEIKKDCTPCHDSVKGGKIAGLGKDWAHKTCKGCHEQMKKGPVKCNDCHKK
jgi:predicted CXXCH cytochrome family protein